MSACFGLRKLSIGPRLPSGAASIRFAAGPDHPQVMFGLIPIEHGVDLPCQFREFSSTTIEI